MTRIRAHTVAAVVVAVSLVMILAVITPTSETAMAERAHSQITRFDGGSHLTLISHPEAVTAVILDAAHRS